MLSSREQGNILYHILFRLTALVERISAPLWLCLPEQNAYLVPYFRESELSRAMKPIKRKAFAYITCGHRLLVFRHRDDPDAGIQVPAGTIEIDELPEAAVLREAFEETGLADLVLVKFLGEQILDVTNLGRNEVHHRYFYHLRCPGNPPQEWTHAEMHPSTGEAGPIFFEMFWAELPYGVPELIADHGIMLPVLVEHLLLG